MKKKDAEFEALVEAVYQALIPRLDERDREKAADSCGSLRRAVQGFAEVANRASTKDA